MDLKLLRRALLGAFLIAAALGGPARAEDPFIVVASTTSTEQSGLFGWLLPHFKQATGIGVRVVAVGTGQALDMGRRGDADVVFVHDQVAEERFVAQGWSTERHPVMYNDFVLVGPKSDPAALRGRDIAAALKKLEASPAPFVSRGDRSGTHAAELRLWAKAGVDLTKARPAGYRDCGCGMGPALNMASSMNAYTLFDVYAFVDVPKSVFNLVDQTRITFRIRNLTDKRYAQWGDPGYTDQVILGAPRSYEVAASFKW